MIFPLFQDDQFSGQGVGRQVRQQSLQRGGQFLKLGRMDAEDDDARISAWGVQEPVRKILVAGDPHAGFPPGEIEDAAVLEPGGDAGHIMSLPGEPVSELDVDILIEQHPHVTRRGR